jgi:hypothetical protein
VWQQTAIFDRETGKITIYRLAQDPQDEQRSLPIEEHEH